MKNLIDRNQQREVSEFEEKVVQVNRVSKKTKGGNNIGFSVLMVVGDRKGRVGVGLGKAPDVLSAIKKGVRRAKKQLVRISMKKTTIPFQMTYKYGAAKILLKPAPAGTGVIAGGAVRVVVEAAGIRDIVSKILGSRNQASNVYATFGALKMMRMIASEKGLVDSRPTEEKLVNGEMKMIKKSRKENNA
ncbi:30S ribosomal protein S5 [Microgenomates group bacterium RIFCSPLOWO2_01_FULL_46_13]|nr:MAG: 30S ribosomal protein S5 [Microgenomates group bacterium RIFCSPLOWO2_01_FULL_46_13]